MAGVGPAELPGLDHPAALPRRQRLPGLHRRVRPDRVRCIGAAPGLADAGRRALALRGSGHRELTQCARRRGEPRRPGHPRPAVDGTDLEPEPAGLRAGQPLSEHAARWPGGRLGPVRRCGVPGGFHAGARRAPHAGCRRAGPARDRSPVGVRLRSAGAAAADDHRDLGHGGHAVRRVRPPAMAGGASVPAGRRRPRRRHDAHPRRGRIALGPVRAAAAARSSAARGHRTVPAGALVRAGRRASRRRGRTRPPAGAARGRGPRTDHRRARPLAGDALRSRGAGRHVRVRARAARCRVARPLRPGGALREPARRLRARSRGRRAAARSQRALGVDCVCVRAQPLPGPRDGRVLRRRLRPAPHAERLREPAALDARDRDREVPRRLEHPGPRLLLAPPDSRTPTGCPPSPSGRHATRGACPRTRAWTCVSIRSSTSRPAGSRCSSKSST